MARGFVGASNQFISVGSRPVFLTGSEIRTVGFWFRVANPATRQAMFTIKATTEGTNSRFCIEVRDSKVDLNYFSARLSGATTLSADTWYHCAVTYGSNNLAIYLNGSSDASATVTLNTGADVFNIGTFLTSSLNMTGQIAEIGMWPEILGSAGLASLAKGFSPSNVRPQILEHHIPFVRDLNDVVGRLALTDNNGSTVTDHPRVYA